MVFQIRSTLDPDYQSHDCPHLTVVVFQIRPNYQNPDCPVFQISRPCLPCRSVCDQVVCTPSCQADETQVIHFDLTDLALEPWQTAVNSSESLLQPYFVTVKAVTGFRDSVFNWGLH